MKRFVVDSSVAVKWFVGDDEPDRDEALSLADACAHARIEVHAPALLLFEVGNVIVMRARRLRRVPNVKAIEDLGRLPIRWHAFDLPLSARSLELADMKRLTFHDAAFVALAEEIDGALVTADRQLADALPRTRARLLGRDDIAM